jgi:hypothetical protein
LYFFFGGKFHVSASPDTAELAIWKEDGAEVTVTVVPDTCVGVIFFALPYNAGTQKVF